MRKHLFGAVMVLCLSAAVAMAQTAGASASATTGQTSTSQSQPATTNSQAMTSNSQSQPASASSSDLQTKIADALANDPMLNNVNFKQVQVNVTPDKVILTGFVPNKPDREHMVQVAQSYAGTRQVVDQLSDKAVPSKGGMGASGMSATPGGDPMPVGGQTNDKKIKK